MVAQPHTSLDLSHLGGIKKFTEKYLFNCSRLPQFPLGCLSLSPLEEGM